MSDLIDRKRAIAEIYEKFMCIDGGVHDDTAKKCIEILLSIPSEVEE